MKKLWIYGTWIAMLAIASTLPLLAQNVNRVALKAYYPANVATSFPSTGIGPRALAFDGKNIWAVNSLDSSLTVLRASDGQVMCTVPLSGQPTGIAYDGAYMWITDPIGNQVFSVQANTCDPFFDFIAPAPAPVVAAFPLPPGATNPAGIAFDGTAIWVANAGAAFVTRETVQNGAVVPPVANIALPAAATGAVAYDGRHIWVATVPYSGTSGGTSVVAVNANGGLSPTGSVFCEPHMVSPGTLVAFAFDGVNNMWAGYADAGGDIIRFTEDTVSGSCSATNALSTALSAIETDMVFDGSSLWIAYGGLGTVQKVAPVILGGSVPVRGTFSIGFPTGLAFDGANVWVSEFSAGAGSNGMIGKL